MAKIIFTLPVGGGCPDQEDITDVLAECGFVQSAASVFSDNNDGSITHNDGAGTPVSTSVAKLICDTATVAYDDALPVKVFQGAACSPVEIPANIFTPSALANNSDGTYTHSAGGVDQPIDTRADSNPYNPAGTGLAALTVGDAIDELATENRPHRIAGAAGADGLQAQPTNDDGVSVTDDIQHIGSTLLGGAVGNLPEAQLEVKGFVRAERGAAVYEYQSTGTVSTLDSELLWTLYEHDSPDHPFPFWSVQVRNPDRSFVQNRQFIIDNKGNMSNNDFPVVPVGITTEQHLQLFIDGPAGTDNETIAPAGALQNDTVALWAKNALGSAELFVMDGLGNVTQLSSHPALAAEILPPPDWYPNPKYDWSYNLMTRLLTGVLNLNSNSRVLQANIDTGDYEVYDMDGSVKDSGQDDRLVYAKQHAEDLEISKLSTLRSRVSAWNNRQQVNADKAINAEGGKEKRSARSAAKNTGMKISDSMKKSFSLSQKLAKKGKK